jgi:hypothetical protein
LIAAAATIGGRAARTSPERLAALRRYGDAIGLAFQIADDVLDLTATSDQLGKTAGRDLQLQKSTYPALLGIDGAKSRAAALVREDVPPWTRSVFSPRRWIGSRTSRSSAPLRFHAMSLLDRIQSPADLRALTRDELRTLADEMRARLVDVCSRTGGHIGAGLGVVELTIALHAAFRTPRDQLVWDVGHQGYPHKLLTGRNAQMETLRQEGGVSGFLKRSESEYDTFGAGHAATAISAALGHGRRTRHQRRGRSQGRRGAR